MSKTTRALESAVAIILQNKPSDGDPTARQRAEIDRAFAHILKLIAPRIRHYIRQYGLAGHWDDAEQCCAIAVYRAIEAYEPEKAQFTTFVNWQIRGELQSLRFRLMTDQRPSAKKVAATTVSLSALATSPDGDEIAPEAMVEDEEAIVRVEEGASDYLAERAMDALIDAYIAQLRKSGIETLRRRPRPKRQEAALRRDGMPLHHATWGVDPAELDKLDAKLARDREIVQLRLFQAAPLEDMTLEAGVTKERVRQITKRAAKAMAEIAASDPRFAVMTGFDERPEAQPVPPSVRAPVEAPSLLPNPESPHNRLASVRAIEPDQPAADAGMSDASSLAKMAWGTHGLSALLAKPFDGSVQ